MLLPRELGTFELAPKALSLTEAAGRAFEVAPSSAELGFGAKIVRRECLGGATSLGLGPSRGERFLAGD